VCIVTAFECGIQPPLVQGSSPQSITATLLAVGACIAKCWVYLGLSRMVGKNGVFFGASTGQLRVVLRAAVARRLASTSD